MNAATKCRSGYATDITNVRDAIEEQEQWCFTLFYNEGDDLLQTCSDFDTLRHASFVIAEVETIQLGRRHMNLREYGILTPALLVRQAFLLLSLVSK